MAAKLDDSERLQWLGSSAASQARRRATATQRKAILSKTQNLSWRARRNSWRSSLAVIFMLVVPPCMIILTWITLEYFDGSLLAMFASIAANGVFDFLHRYYPAVDSNVVLVYSAWVLFQAGLYTVLPGRSTGQRTASGNLLEYRTNGFLAWIITMALAGSAWWSGMLDAAVIARNFETFPAFLNYYGVFLSIVAFVKAYVAPSHAEDRTFSGSILYDFYMGVEFNPRFGKDWDWKLFHNGRPGIIAWTLIDLSYAALQYQQFGYVTNSMVIVTILHTIYVVDFFVNESWYTRTIDICHDHFGFYLAHGSAAWLPCMYTIQAQYLARNPVQLSNTTAACILLTGFAGYTIFRSANHQKDHVRRAEGKATIWGRPAKFMRCTYTTADGVERESMLLVSGWWGVARHSNYLGDIILSTAMSAGLGFRDLLPWFYPIFMASILIHRCFRDEKRCSLKYGRQWDEYCSKVRWRIFPGIW